MEKKADRKIVEALNSLKESTVISTIYKLKDNGTAEILPYLFKLFFTTESEKIRIEILVILNNIKDKSAAPYFIEAVRKYKGQPHYDQIISACWQNGLDFSSAIRDFVNLVIEQDVQTAIEAFSVVEENISELSAIEREQEAIYINSRIRFTEEGRQKLATELLHVVENISGPLSLNIN